MVRRVRFAGEDYVESNERPKKSPHQDHCAIWTDDDESDTEQATTRATTQAISFCRQTPPKSKQDPSCRPISNIRLLLDRQREQEERAGGPLLCQTTPRRRFHAPPLRPRSGAHTYSFLTPGTTALPIPIPGRSIYHPFNGTDQILNVTCLSDGLPPAELPYELPDGSGNDQQGENMVWVPWQIDPKVNQWSFMTNQRLREDYERRQYQNRLERATALGWLRK